MVDACGAALSSRTANSTSSASHRSSCSQHPHPARGSAGAGPRAALPPNGRDDDPHAPHDDDEVLQQGADLADREDAAGFVLLRMRILFGAHPPVSGIVDRRVEGLYE